MPPWRPLRRHPCPRVEDARLLTGRGTFVDDIALPGMLHACFVRSPHARASVTRIDTAEAPSPARDPPRPHRCRPQPARPRAVAHVGRAEEPGDAAAALIAEGDEGPLRRRPGGPRPRRRPLPRRGRRRPRHRRLRAAPAAVDYVRALDEGAPLVHTDHGANLIGRMRGRKPDDEALVAALGGAAPRRAGDDPPAGLRRRAARRPGASSSTPTWSPASSRSTPPTQSPHEWRLFCARLLGIPEHRIRVVMKDTGGGFGRRSWSSARTWA